MPKIKLKRRVMSAVDFISSGIEVEYNIKNEFLEFHKKMKKKYPCIIDSDVHNSERRGDRKLDLTRVKMRLEKPA